MTPLLNGESGVSVHAFLHTDTFLTREDDVDSWETMPPKDTAEVAWRIKSIREMEMRIGRFQEQKKDAVNFYDERVKALLDRIAQTEKQIHDYLAMNEVKTLTTHHGTATLAKTVERTWPEPSVLLAFAKKEQIPDAVKIEESPVKAAISKYMTETGNVPEGYNEVEVTKLRLRK